MAEEKSLTEALGFTDDFHVSVSKKCLALVEKSETISEMIEKLGEDFREEELGVQGELSRYEKGLVYHGFILARALHIKQNAEALASVRAEAESLLGLQEFLKLLRGGKNED